MKIKRFVAKDMRAALIMVKEELGADAVIMSNKKLSHGIEIVAAMDYDPNLMSKQKKQQVSTKIAQPSAPKSSSAQSSNKKSQKIDSLTALLEKQKHKEVNQLPDSDRHRTVADWAKNLHKKENKQQNINNEDIKIKSNNVNKEISFKEISSMRQELSSLRHLLTHQMTHLLVNEKYRHDPIGSMFEEKLQSIGFSHAIAMKLAKLTKGYTPYQFTQIMPKKLAGMMLCQGDHIIRKGGVIALVGSTGVGKTTTIAKIAARAIAQYGVDNVALITCDNFRIGAYEQLATYSKIMGCQIQQVEKLSELENHLHQLMRHKLVLIDTPGMGQRDKRLHPLLDELSTNQHVPVSNYLVLPATAQRQVLEDAIAHFSTIKLAGGIISKIDEAISIAQVLNVFIQHQLSLSFITDGQRVPEDLKLAEPLFLANQALELLDNDVENDFLTNTQWMDDINHAS